jgi:hypothetical protein
MTVVTSSVVGGAGMSMAVDFFVEQGRMSSWIWSQVKGREVTEFCWFSWLVLALWPTLILAGSLAQCFLTARGFTIQTCKRKPKRKRRVQNSNALLRYYVIITLYLNQNYYKIQLF